MSSWTVNLFGIRDGFISLQVAKSESAFLKTTVLGLKKKIHEEMSEIQPDGMRLLFAGKQLEDTDGSGGDKTLEDYNIQSGSHLQVVLRLHGGSGNKYRVPAPPRVEDKQHNTSDFSLKFTTVEPDAILGESEPGDQPRVKMSCGHAVDPNSLTMWCRSLIDQEQYRLHCPAIIGGGKKCKKEWEYPEVRKIALLNAAECKYFETRLSEYAARTYCDLQECPGCRSFVERLDLDNLRVHCVLCTKDKGRNYDFCWHCLKEWSGPTTSAVKCGNSSCQHPELPSVRDSSLFKLNGEDVPLRRACPTCGKVVEHKQEGCKYMPCPRCHKEYCFMCLELKDDCLRIAPESWFGKCAKPIAPKQTTFPVWSRAK